MPPDETRRFATRRMHVAATALALIALATLQVALAAQRPSLAGSVQVAPGVQAVAYELHGTYVPSGGTLELDVIFDGGLPPPGRIGVSMTPLLAAPKADTVRIPAAARMLPGRGSVLRLRVRVNVAAGAWKLSIAGSRSFGIVRVT